jgi:phosphate transport system permease protein
LTDFESADRLVAAPGRRTLATIFRDLADLFLTARGRARLPDLAFKYMTMFFSIVVLAILGGIILYLAEGSWLAFKTFGLGFLFSSDWNPGLEPMKFGALAPVYGTVVTSLIAMVIGVPLSFGVAIFITELCPLWLKRSLSTAIELLAGIPSIIYGMWGLFTVVPLLQADVEPFLITWLGHAPLIDSLFKGPPLGVGILTAGVILAVMVLPFISSIMRDVFETVPPMLKESAYGLGCTTWEVMWNIVLPYTKVGVVGGVMLGLGRAMGETMAVTYVIGNSSRISPSLLAPGKSIASTLANEFNNTSEPLYLSSLIALGLVLFLLTFIVLAAAKVMLVRLQHQAGR